MLYVLRFKAQCVFPSTDEKVSSKPYLVPVGLRGSWYDLYLHHLQLPLHYHSTKSNSAHHQCLPPPARHPAFHRFLCVVFLPPARQRWHRLPCCTRGCPPNSKSFAIVPSYPGTRPNAVGAPRTASLRRNISVASWNPSNRKSATTTLWNSEGPTGFMPMARTLVNFIQRRCELFSPLIMSRIRSRTLVGTLRVCILPQSPAVKQPLGVHLCPHLCGAPLSRLPLITSGPQDFAVP